MRRRATANAAVLAALRIGAPLCSAAVVVAVSRRLGAADLGRYSLAYAYLALCGLLGPLGLPGLLTREGARDRTALGRLLSSGLALGGGVSVVLSVVMACLSRLGEHDPATARALQIASLAILPSTWLSCFEAAFLACEDTIPIALAVLAEQAAKAGLGVAAVLAGHGLEAVLAAAVAGRAVACAVSIVLLRRRGVRLSVRADLASIRSLAAQAPVFALSSLCATLYWRVDVLLLSRLRDVSEVGQYTAAYRILDVAILLPQSLCQALYPRLAGGPQGRATGVPEYRAAALRWLVLLTAPLALAVSALAGPLLALLYGQSFSTAAPLLVVLIWTAVPYAWSRYHACLLVATDRQRADLAINAALLVLNVALNLTLIPRYGARGAAAVTLVTALVYSGAQFSYLRRRPSLERRSDTAPALT